MARSKAFFKSQQQCTQGTVSVNPSSNLNSCPERLCEGKGQTLRKDDSRDRPLAIHLNYLCNYRRHTVARMGARSELDEKSPADNRNWSTITTLGRIRIIFAGSGSHPMQILVRKRCVQCNNKTCYVKKREFLFLQM